MRLRPTAGRPFCSSPLAPGGGSSLSQQAGRDRGEAGEWLGAGAIGGRLGSSSSRRLLVCDDRWRLDGTSSSKSSVRRGESGGGVRKVSAVFAGNSRSELLVVEAAAAYGGRTHGLCSTNRVCRGAGKKALLPGLRIYVCGEASFTGKLVGGVMSLNFFILRIPVACFYFV